MDGVLRAGTRIRLGWPRLAELALIALLVVMVVRLAWTILSPVGPTPGWRGRSAIIPSPAARAMLFRAFDAFYPAPAAGPDAATVTSLALTVYGVRVNEASGQGSAIIAGPDGQQGSYAVGDEIQPGVTLKAVLFDHVVIDRGGVEETVFLDQSQPVTPVAPVPSPATDASPQPTAVLPPVPLTIDSLKAGIGFAPRGGNGRVTGIVVTSRGPGFDAAGFRPGDVIIQVNGRQVSSAGDLAILQQTLAPGARISLMVERGASTVPIAILVPEK